MTVRTLYKKRLRIVFSEDPEVVLKAQGDLDDFKPEPRDMLAFTCFDSSVCTIILNFNHKDPITHGIIAHEALHAAAYILDHVDVSYDSAGDEQVTYLVEWITNEVYKAMAKNNITI